MNNPLALFRNLRDLYLSYLNSPFALRYSDLVVERRNLLDRNGYLWREPLIEPVPAYPTIRQGFRSMAHQLLDNNWGAAAVEEVADFVACGALAADLEPYEHQQRAFERSVVGGNDVVVTTGTGSGKTECFLLPIITNLVRESAGWGAPAARSPQWDWWSDRHKYFQGQNIRYAPRIPQRAHEDRITRPAAIRALLLYPLNALVEDQLIRLREALDSAPARSWLDSHRCGNRLYFWPLYRTYANIGRPQFDKHASPPDRTSRDGARCPACLQRSGGAPIFRHDGWSRNVVALGHARRPSRLTHHELLDA